MWSSPIVFDYSTSSYPLVYHPRAAAAVATTSGSVFTQCPAIKFRSINVSLCSFPSSSKLLVSYRRSFCCRFGDGSSRFDSTESDYCSYVDGDGGGENEVESDGDDYLVDCLADGKTQDLVVGEDFVLIEVKKLEKSSRRIRAKIGMEASLDSVWNLLTAYEKLTDYAPGLAVSEVVEKEGNRVRVYQVGQQNLGLGFKFSAKAVLDCFEKELEILPHGKRREIGFKMVEGDFQLYEGKWSIEQFEKGIEREVSDLQFEDARTTLEFSVDLKPKMWIPVRLVEGRLCKDLKINLLSMRDAAQKVIEAAIHDL